MNKTGIRFWARVLALLGFGGALDSCRIINFPACEYGCPYSDYKLSGTVTDKDGKPVPGISVRQYHDPGTGSADIWEGGQLTQTQPDGSFVVEDEFVSFGGDFEFIFRDVDGAENGGEFEDRTQKVEFKQTQKGDNRWYGGKYEATGVKVVLEPRKKN